MRYLRSRHAVLSMLLLAASAQAQETRLVCEGLTIETAPGAVPEALDHEIRIALFDDHVEVSDTGEAAYSVREGIVWIWTRAVAGEDYLYNLDTISGRLRTIVSPEIVSPFGNRRINRILSYQCNQESE